VTAMSCSSGKEPSRDGAGALSIARLSAGYGKQRVIAGLTVPPLPAGTVTVLVGPNGAGKSTLLKALAGLVPARGNAMLDGRDLLALPPAQRAATVGFMPQALPGNMGLGVLDSVITALKVSQPDLPTRQARERAVRILERLGILPLALSSLDRLSGGQKQMASLAQAIVSDPSVLLLDEPVSALDLRHQFHVMRTIRALAAEGRVVVVVLHDLALASRWADRVVVLRDGSLFDAGAPADVITPAMLEEVYGVDASVMSGAEGNLHIAISDIARGPGHDPARGEAS